jgi:putative phosphoesterase
MRIAVISDIHSNLEALRSVLSAVDQLHPDTVYCLGDIVGYGPYPNECIDLVRTRCSAVVMGNHDSGVLGATPLRHFNQYGRAAVEWTTERVTPQNLAYLNHLSMTQEIGDMTLAHASPLKPEQWNYVVSWPEAKKTFKAFRTTVCCIGHTHVPMIVSEDSGINTFRRNSRFLVNVGSVGQPRDGNPRASFCLLDTESWTCEIHRVEYNIEKTAQAILGAGLPEFLARRLSQGI